MVLASTFGYVAGRYYSKQGLRSVEIAELRNFCNRFVADKLSRDDVEAAQDVLRQPIRGSRLRELFDHFTVVMAYVVIPKDWYDSSKREVRGKTPPRVLGIAADRKDAVRPILRILKRLDDEQNIVEKIM